MLTTSMALDLDDDGILIACDSTRYLGDWRKGAALLTPRLFYDFRLALPVKALLASGRDLTRTFLTPRVYSASSLIRVWGPLSAK